MAYGCTLYSVPARTKEHTCAGNTTVYTDWVAVGPIVAPSITPWFVLPEGFVMVADMNKNGIGPSVSPFLAFANDADSIRFWTGGGGWIARPTQTYAATMVPCPRPFTFTGTVTKMRMGLSINTDTWITVSATIFGGILRLYETSAAAPIEASCIASAPVFVGGAINQEITRFRYRISQPVTGAGTWCGTPAGEAKLRRFS